LVSTLNSGSRVPGWHPGLGHCSLTSCCVLVYNM